MTFIAYITPETIIKCVVSVVALNATTDSKYSKHGHTHKNAIKGTLKNDINCHKAMFAKCKRTH